jgi:Integrase core domain
MKTWLRAQHPAATIDELQHQIDTFVELYNHHRPHRSLPHRATPATIYNTRPKATPDNHQPDAQFRVRHDRVNNGKVTLRINGELHHIGLGRPLDRTPIIALIHDLDIRIIHATTGEILRTLTINPEHRYHGTGAPIGGPKGPRKSKKPGPK